MRNVQLPRKNTDILHTPRPRQRSAAHNNTARHGARRDTPVPVARTMSSCSVGAKSAFIPYALACSMRSPKRSSKVCMASPRKANVMRRFASRSDMHRYLNFFLRMRWNMYLQCTQASKPASQQASAMDAVNKHVTYRAEEEIGRTTTRRVHGRRTRATHWS